MAGSTFKRELYISKATRYAEFVATYNTNPRSTCKQPLVSDETKIANWRNVQAADYKKGSLTVEKLEILSDICPYIFDGIRINNDWDIQYRKLERFIRDNLITPRKHVDDKEEALLGHWYRGNIYNYRVGKLGKEKIDKLAKLVPQYFGGNKEDSLINRLKREKARELGITSGNDLKVNLGCSELQLNQLKRLGIVNTEQLKSRLTDYRDLGLREEILEALKLKPDKDCLGILRSVVQKKTIEAAINPLIYETNSGDIKLAKIVLRGLDTREFSGAIAKLIKYRELILDNLTEKERLLITERLYNNKTLQTIGNEWGITKERVRQLEVEAIYSLEKLSLGGIEAKERINS